MMCKYACVSEEIEQGDKERRREKREEEIR